MAALAGRTAIVTGAGSGIGRAIAARLAAEGALVGVNDVREDGAATVARELGREVEPLVFDVTDSAAVDDGVDGFVARHGRLDVLVNNAGVGNPYKPGQLDRVVEVGRRRAAGQPAGSLGITTRLTDDEFRRVIDVLLIGPFFCTRAALRHMEPAGRGAIVNIASTAGLMPAPLAPEYGAAKAGVSGSPGRSRTRSQGRGSASTRWPPGRSTRR